MKHAIYNLTTGEISRIVMVPDHAHLLLNIGDGEDSLEVGDGINDATHYVQAGAFVAFPSQPDPAHVWDWGSKAWSDPRTVEERLEIQWADVRAKRDALLAQSDWRLVRAVEQGVSLSPQWLNYRQALRDVTSQADPMAISWPQINDQQSEGLQ